MKVRSHADDPEQGRGSEGMGGGIWCGVRQSPGGMGGAGQAWARECPDKYHSETCAREGCVRHACVRGVRGMCVQGVCAACVREGYVRRWNPASVSGYSAYVHVGSSRYSSMPPIQVSRSA